MNQATDPSERTPDHFCTGGNWDNKLKRFVCEHESVANTEPSRELAQPSPTDGLREAITHIASLLHQAGRITGDKPRGEEIQADIEDGVRQIMALLEQSQAAARIDITEYLTEHAIEYDAVDAERWDWNHKGEAPRMMIPLSVLSKYQEALNKGTK